VIQGLTDEHVYNQEQLWLLNSFAKEEDVFFIAAVPKEMLCLLKTAFARVSPTKQQNKTA
jgi:hypothetical protein